MAAMPAVVAADTYTQATFNLNKCAHILYTSDPYMWGVVQRTVFGVIDMGKGAHMDESQSSCTRGLPTNCESSLRTLVACTSSEAR